ncbi:MAG: hypothetical protein R2685_12060 [Candidatus Nitrosocosmicus sp.]|nr:hypothetical protein [Candidatus Nitrosocosmicus sp.]
MKLVFGSDQTARTKDPSNLKNVTINVGVQQGQDPPKKLPITALVPIATTLDQLQLCASAGNQPEQCQPLSDNKVTLDLSGQQANNTASAAPASTYSSSFESPMLTSVAFNDNNINVFSIAVYSPNNAYFVPVQLIDDVNVNVPIDVDVTAIIPINIEIENAQVCANLGGTQTCHLNKNSSFF